jgi:hypothetical protein
LNAHFMQMPEAEREKGVMTFGVRPPGEGLVSELWGRHMRPAHRDGDDVPLDPSAEAMLIERLKAHRKQPSLGPGESAVADDDMVSIERRVRKKRGSWWQVPKDLPDSPDG